MSRLPPESVTHLDNPQTGLPFILASPDSVHVWHADPAAMASTGSLEAWLSLLDGPERARHARLVVEADRIDYLAAHSLLRLALSAHSGVAPRAWRTVPGPHGKPSVAEPLDWTRLSFSLSHTRGRVAVAVAVDRAVGVDAEALSHAGSLEGFSDQ